MRADGAAATPLLVMRNLRIETGAAPGSAVIDGISLDVARGEILGLIGESGAGKSTAGLAALGYTRTGCRHTSGSVVFDGVDLFRISEEERRRFRGSRITYVAQDASASFNPAHRLLNQTIEGAVVHGVMESSVARSNAVRMFGQLRLPEPDAVGLRYPHQLSGGQLQRAMTAMAMCPNPGLIVFDEPTTGLDVTTQVQVLAAIRTVVHDANTAAIYISHDLAVVAQMADRIAIMRAGRIIEEGPTEEILRTPKHRYTRTLWSVRNLRIADRGPAPALMSVCNLNASYGAARVLDDVSIDVPRARTVAVVGESGSGKSTLARCIMGLNRSTSGSIDFDGRRLAPALESRSKDECRRVQMIHQSSDSSLNPRQTVGEIVGRPLKHFFGLGPAKRERRVLEYLEQMGLSPELIHRYAAQLSGGQKQRICLARALAAEPALIVCDEITSSLDQIVQKEILLLLQRVQEATGVSYLFITHDISIVRAIADRLVVMHRGRVVEQGPKTEVFRPPFHPYTALLLSSVPEMDPDWLTRTLAARPSGSDL